LIANGESKAPKASLSRGSRRGFGAPLRALLRRLRSDVSYGVTTALKLVIVSKCFGCVEI